MKIFLVDLESIESRYTFYWKTHLPEMLSSEGFEVVNISGPNDLPSETTPGAFLNFSGTNIYKSNQVDQFSRMINEGMVNSGDYFLFTDAWHPGIINLKYMSELLGIDIKIGALWHAGSYDEHDFLGRLIGDADWVRHAEKSFFHACDHNFFATDFHINLFCEKLLGIQDESEIWTLKNSGKIIRTGWPMEYIRSTVGSFRNVGKKKNTILFPHRLAPEKQLDIFLDLKKELPEYDFIVCQEKNLSKQEYNTLLCESKIVFSANLQETLGISTYEALVAGSIPLVPDRLSYTEMYNPAFKYPSQWTLNFDNYLEHKEQLIGAIRQLMKSYQLYSEKISECEEFVYHNFFNSKNMIAAIRGIS